MANNDMDRVVPLGQLDDYKVADGDPDVRGWEVLSSDGRKIGEVDELLVDTSAMKVRYLDVDVDDGMIAGGMDRHVLIPIGYARLEQERDCVMVDGLASSDLQALPVYDQGPLTRDFESSVRDSFSTRGTSTAAGMTGAGAGMLDTAGLDNTPGMGTGLGMTGVSTSSRAETAALGDQVPDGEGMRAAGYDLDRAPTTGALHTDTGSTRTDSDLGTTGGMSASGTGFGGTAGTDLGATGGLSASGPGLGSTGGRTDLGETGGLSAGSASGPGIGGSNDLGGTSRGDALADSDQTLAGGMSAGAGSQGPVSGTDRGHGDMSHRASTGSAGSDYQHNADEDFYANDAFDDNRFYGARRGGASSPGGMGASSAGGLGDSVGADREETSRLAREASERLREDERNRGVGGSGSL